MADAGRANEEKGIEGAYRDAARRVPEIGGVRMADAGRANEEKGVER